MLVMLTILDGFGLREATPDNAVAAAKKPTYHMLMQTCPFTRLDGSGLAVGLPAGQMGNSEVGHLNLGAGRVVYQDITRIDKAIADGDFFENDVLNAVMERVATENAALHLCGLVSDGGVHSSMEHLYALIELAKQKGICKLYLHAFMDGRDTSPTGGQDYIAQVLARMKQIGLGQVATVSGRYYAMDRDKRWDRVEKAYHAMVMGEGARFSDPVAAIRASYEAKVTDEFIVPVVIDCGEPPAGQISPRDGIIMFNFRADRVRELSQLLLGYENPDVTIPSRPKIELVTMTNYDLKMFEAKPAFQPVRLRNILAEVLAHAGKKQLRTAETEKYAHVTFFFNGGLEQPYAGEDREMIPSPKVATYDLKPEMSSVELTDKAVSKINSGQYDFILLNYANCDMVGHTGSFEAARKAVEAVDTGLGRLLEAVKTQKGVAIVTADHGNAEMMIDPQTGGPFTAHTTNLVPCFLYDPHGRAGEVRLREPGILADIAPTILELLHLDIPREMTGSSLLEDVTGISRLEER